MTEDGPPGVNVADLARWLGDMSGRPVDPATLDIRRPSGGGWSNDTLFVNDVVVRLAPSGPAMFPDYDLGRQCLMMRELSTAGSVPVPAVLDADLEGTRLGRPALIMERVSGRAPSDDRPSFAEAGFLFDASPTDQRHFHLTLLDAVVAIHSTPLSADLAVALGADKRSPLARALDELEKTWTFDRGNHWASVVDDALQHLRLTTPPAQPDGDLLLWGDARPANVLVGNEDLTPVALLDWELATVGPPELDVVWLAEMNRMRMEGSGVPRLAGFLSDDEAIEHYEERSRRTLQHLEWHRLLAATRIAALMHRHLRVMVQLGRLPETHRLFTESVSTRRVVELLGAATGQT